MKGEGKTDTWLRYPIPEKGEAGGFLLTSDVSTEGTGVTAVASGKGVVYAALEEISGSPLDGYDLFKSIDGGYTWEALWRIPDWDKPTGGPTSDPDPRIISLILPDYDEPDILYLATQYYVYKTTDGGKTFSTVGSRPCYGSGTNPSSSELITSLDVVSYRGSYLVLVGSRDADVGPNDYGGVYLLDESQRFTSWIDLEVGNGKAGTVYDVLDVAFAANFRQNQQVVALVSDDLAPLTKVTSRFSSSGWDSTSSDAIIGPFPSTRGSLAFPSDYDVVDPSLGKNMLYAGIDAGAASSIYMIILNPTPSSSRAIPMLPPDASNAVFSMDIIGDSQTTTLIAGLTSGDVISWSFLSGLAGRPSTPPAGVTAQNACVSIGELDMAGYSVYVGTTGIGSALAKSTDSGDTFSQIAFICDDLEQILDLAISPSYSDDGTIYLISKGSSNRSILWRTTDFGKRWEAVLSEGQIIKHGDSLTQVSHFSKVEISPYFSLDTTVFIAESINKPRVWRSIDNGFHFSPLSKTGTSGTISSWVIVGRKVVLVGDSHGNFYRTDNGGTTWKAITSTGLSDFSSLAISPDYENDGTILASDSTGGVYLSEDRGETWQRLGISPSGLGANTVVAFSPFYKKDRIVYAADASTDTGILRFTIGSSDEWERIDKVNPKRSEEATKASKTNISALEVIGNGDNLSTLYATHSSPVVKRVEGIAPAEGGLVRCLNPEAHLTPESKAPLFEIVNEGLKEGTTLVGLWSTHSSPTILWSIDTSNIPNILYTYTDTLSLPLEILSPADGAPTGDETSAQVAWQEVDSATSYNLECDTDSSFRQPLKLYTSAPEMTIRGLLSGTIYYWRVRVGKQGSSIFEPGTTITYGAPAIGRFSKPRSFITSVGRAGWSPFGPPTGISPKPGEVGVSLKPTFQWNPADDAVSYEFELSDNAAFAGADTKVLKMPVYKWPGKLEEGKTYYWRVRSVKANGATSEWAVGIFTTEKEKTEPPSPAPAPAPPPAPPTIQVPTLPSTFFWAIIGATSLLLFLVIFLIFKSRRK